MFVFIDEQIGWLNTDLIHRVVKRPDKYEVFVGPSEFPLIIKGDVGAILKLDKKVNT